MIPLVVLDGGDITLQLESTGSRCRQNEGGAYSPILLKGAAKKSSTKRGSGAGDFRYRREYSIFSIP